MSEVPQLVGSLKSSTSVCGRELFVDNLLVRIHFITVMIRWTGLAPWEFEFSLTGSLHLPSQDWSDR